MQLSPSLVSGQDPEYRKVFVLSEVLGVAVNKIKEKSFFVFAISKRVVKSEGKLQEIFVVDPPQIEKLMGPLLERVKNVYVLPWQTKPLTVNIEDSTDRERFAALLNEEVDRVETEDPYIKKIFGTSGIGEGLVMYAFPRKELFTRRAFDNSTFKAKGEKHRVVKQPTAIVVDTQRSASAEAFADMFVTEARCEQGIASIVGPNPEDASKLVSSMTAQFLRWMLADIQKESAAELEASKLTWKEVQKPVNKRISEYFKQRLNAS